ncbi:hypothetical protein E2562_035963 [Oryza meyeriana var. granulata]|uniref:Uncharacterized protein n=1 Tax=Oryza meyeriana var. granulata TaxID=110450 RepID=A0A6G1F200_9ORYZ|nr:hypothetical protein E2562_035963 [Oryza meyeriana var. granulata]
MEHGDGTAPASAVRAWTSGALLVKSALPVQGMEQASGATRPVTSPSARHQCGGWQWPARVSPPLTRWLAADLLGSAVRLGVEAAGSGPEEKCLNYSTFLQEMDGEAMDRDRKCRFIFLQETAREAADGEVASLAGKR